MGNIMDCKKKRELKEHKKNMKALTQSRTAIQITCNETNKNINSTVIQNSYNEIHGNSANLSYGK